MFKEPQGSIIDGPFALYVLNRYTESGIPTLLNAIQKNRELFPYPWWCWEMCQERDRTIGVYRWYVSSGVRTP